MLEILNAELFKDISANLLVVPCSHLCEGVCGLFIPFLAFGEKEVKESRPIRTRC
jgi:hypothetical protein